MKKGHNRIKRQHYIPKTILKHHTYFIIPMREPLIFLYNKETGKENLVSIKDVAYSRDLYELFNEKKYIIHKTTNIIEEYLSEKESKINPLISKMESKLQLTKEDVDFLYEYTVLQTLRMPIALDIISEYCSNIAPQFAHTDIANYCKLSCLVPDLSDLTNGIIHSDIYNTFITDLKNYSLEICEIHKPLIINIKMPILFFGFYENNSIIIFPLTKKMCLIYIKNSVSKHIYRKNYMPDIFIDFFNKLIFTLSPKYILSSSSIAHTKNNIFHTNNLNSYNQNKISNIDNINLKQNEVIKYANTPFKHRETPRL